MARAIGFERENLALAAGNREEHPLGLWTRSATQPQLWGMNQLHVIGPQPALTAGELGSELDRGLADARHRRAVVDDDATGRRLADAMRGAGFDVAPLMVMLLEAEPPAPPDGVAHLVDELTATRLEQRLIRDDGEIPPRDHDIVIAGHAQIRATVPGTRSYAGRHAGEDVCQTTLFCREGTGQPENVQTLTSHRGRGLASATVALATRDAVAAGCDLVFIVCHADTGPFPLYAGLGYVAAGRFWAFTRPG